MFPLSLQWCLEKSRLQSYLGYGDWNKLLLRVYIPANGVGEVFLKEEELAEQRVALSGRLIGGYFFTPNRYFRFHSHMTAPNILTQLVQLAGNISNAFTTTLFVADPVERSLTLKYYHSLSQSIKLDAKLSFGEGHIGQVAKTGQSILKENFAEDSSILNLYNRFEDLKGFMAVPVKNDYLLGVLALDTKESYSFSVRTQKIIGSLANLMAWHLSNEIKETEETGSDWLLNKELMYYTQSIADSMHPVAMAEQLCRIPTNLLQFDAMAVVWMDEEQKKGKIVLFSFFIVFFPPLS